MVGIPEERMSIVEYDMSLLNILLNEYGIDLPNSATESEERFG
jgi:hypothetical protein